MWLTFLLSQILILIPYLTIRPFYRVSQYDRLCFGISYSLFFFWFCHANTFPPSQESNGYTAAYCAGKFFHHKHLAVLLAAGTSPTAGSRDATMSLIHERAQNGSIA